MNNPSAWFQFALYVAALLLVTKPLGLFLGQVLDARAPPRARATAAAPPLVHPGGPAPPTSFLTQTALASFPRTSTKARTAV